MRCRKVSFVRPPDNQSGQFRAFTPGASKEGVVADDWETAAVRALNEALQSENSENEKPAGALQ